MYFNNTNVQKKANAVHMVGQLPLPASGDAKILLSASNLIEI